MNLFKFIKDADIKTSEIMEAINLYLTKKVHENTENYYIVDRFLLYEFVFKSSSIDVSEKEITNILDRAINHFNINHKYAISITPTVIFIGRKDKDKFHW